METELLWVDWQSEKMELAGFDWQEEQDFMEEEEVVECPRCHDVEIMLVGVKHYYCFDCELEFTIG